MWTENGTLLRVDGTLVTTCRLLFSVLVIIREYKIGALYWIEVLDCGQNRDSCLYQGKDSEFGVQIIEVSVGEINASFMKVAEMNTLIN